MNGPSHRLVAFCAVALVICASSAALPQDSPDGASAEQANRQSSHSSTPEPPEPSAKRVSITLDPLYLLLPPLLSLRDDMIGFPGVSVQGEFRLPADFSMAGELAWLHLRQTRTETQTVSRNEFHAGVQPRWYPSGGFDNGFYTGLDVGFDAAGRTFDSQGHLRTGFDPRVSVGPIVGGKFIAASGFTVGGTAGVITAFPLPNEAPNAWFQISSVPIYRFTRLQIGWSF